MSDNDSYNQGLWGTGPTGNTNWNDYQQGKSIREWNERALAEQNNAAAPTWGSDGGSSVGGFAQPMPTYGASTYAGGVGFGGSVPHGPPGVFSAIVAAPIFLISLPLWAALYPLAAIATLATAWAMDNILPGIAGTLTRQQMTLTSAATAVVVLGLATRVEQRLGRLIAYRYLRYAMRLLTLALFVIGMMSPVPGIRAALDIPRIVGQLIRQPATLTIPLVGAIVLLFLSLRPSLQRPWHWVLTALRLRKYEPN